jgi:hypothetical protein
MGFNSGLKGLTFFPITWKPASLLQACKNVVNRKVKTVPPFKNIPTIVNKI